MRNTGSKRVLNKGGWRNVAVVDSDFSWLPFTIQRKGRKFRAKSFNMQQTAGITVAKSYYVDGETGNDSNSGLDWDNALEKPKTAFAKADVDRVYIKPHYYYYNEQQPDLPNRDLEIIGIGDGVILSCDFHNECDPWNAVDNHYESQNATTMYGNSVVDWSNLDEYGNPQLLTKKTDVAGVDSTPGSYFYDYKSINATTSEVYIRTFDDREPDSDIAIREDTLTLSHAIDNGTYYIENIDLHNGGSLRNNTAAGGTKYYFKNCRFYTEQFAINGVDAYFEDCIFRGGDDDQLDFDERNGVAARGVELNCTFHHNQGTGTSNQASTAHGASKIVRINSLYYDISGQIIADIEGGKSWLLGCTLHTSRNAGTGFHTEGTAWLDRCFIGTMATYAINEAAAGAVYTRNVISGGNFNGTVSEY